MEGSEPEYPSASHAPNHDSMVTVALSDNQSSSEHTQPDWRTLNIPPTPVEMTHLEKESEESFGPVPLQDAARTTPTPETPGADRGRQTGEMFDNEVDWENLDKTEEQEPRGEGSDEVSVTSFQRILELRGRANIPDLILVHGPAPRSTRTRKQCFGDQPQIWDTGGSRWKDTPAAIPL